jgi:AraC-like DNA-binding protein
MADFSFRLVPLTLKLLEARGVSATERAALLALLPDGSDTAAEVTAPVEVVNAFLDRAEALARVPAFGITLATAVPRGTYAQLEFIARLSCTLEEAMVCVGRFYRLLNKGADISYVERSEVAGLEVRVHGRKDGWGRVLNEYTLALFHRITKEVCPPWQPAHVWFAHETPNAAALDALAQYFGVTPTFGAATLGIDGPEELMDAPLNSADAELQSLLRGQAARALEEDQPLAALAERLKQELKARLGKEALSIEAVAPALGCSVRTLQRRLQDEGLTYQDVLDGVRAQVAKAWLANRHRNVGELASMLGYSEPSAFDRAFRRWTGKTPTAWREVGSVARV